jgi:hypothetical protein
MNLPGFTADVSLYTRRQHFVGTDSVHSKDLSGIYPAKLKDENAGVNCNNCFGAQCVELDCLGKLLGGGGIVDPNPCLNHSICSACIPTGPSIFSPGRQFCQDYICSPGFNGTCRCTVFKGFRPCTLPTPVLTTGFRR